MIHEIHQTMFPLKYCGVWCLVYTTNPIIPHSTMMHIQYNRVEITPTQDFKLFQLKRTHQGVVYVRDDTHAKVMWSKKVNYEMDSPFLPTLPFYGKEMNCRPIELNYTMDETNTYCTFVSDYEYVFHRYMPTEKKDTILKIFMTQLLFDFIIRQI
jgi:hypothetical protein